MWSTAAADAGMIIRVCVTWMLLSRDSIELGGGKANTLSGEVAVVGL